MNLSHVFTNQTWLLATSNKGKTLEIESILAPFNLQFENLQQLRIGSPDENGLTFIENALIKAQNGAKHSGLPTLADDSGLVVEDLDGAPGIYSSRYAHDEATDAENIQHLIHQLQSRGLERAKAHFHCTLVWCRHAKDPDPIIAQARWFGEVITNPNGQEGFGYDPVFWVPEQQCTAAQLSKVIKNKISHRGQALSILLNELREVSKRG
ncbi:MAG: RdgB/HAM1 family non-canonical purine NTP pyrophosphatase [Pseudomonadota bacterium]